MSIALLSYLAFLLYGSFFPFDFTADYDALRDHLAEAVTRPWDSHGHRVPDVVSNILLRAPFGVLLVIRGLVGTSLTGRITRVLILDLVLAGANVLLLTAGAAAGRAAYSRYRARLPHLPGWRQTC